MPNLLLQLKSKEVHLSLCVQPKKKKKPKPQPEVSAEPAPPEAASPEEGKDEMNGFHANGSVMDGESLDSLSEQLDSASLDAAELDSEPATSETTGNHSSDEWWRQKKEGLGGVDVDVMDICSDNHLKKNSGLVLGRAGGKLTVSDQIMLKFSSSSPREVHSYQQGYYFRSRLI